MKKKHRKADSYRAARRNALRATCNLKYWPLMMLWERANEIARTIREKKSIST